METRESAAFPHDLLRPQPLATSVHEPGSGVARF